MMTDRCDHDQTTPASSACSARGSSAFAVDLRQLSKSYGTLRAVAEVDFRADAGSVVAIVGENGAGKSTLMKMLAGVVSPNSGEILVFGQKRTFSSSRDAAVAGMGMVFQETAAVGQRACWTTTATEPCDPRPGSHRRGP